MTRSLVLALVVAAVAGCTLPGKPNGVSLEGQPAKVEDFDTLFATNCSGCHGEHGRDGAAPVLDNPIFVAITDDELVRGIVNNGVAGTAMPPFGARAGGMLTDRQIDIIARGIRARWGRPAASPQPPPSEPPPSKTPPSETPPPYVGPAGDARRGAALFATFCARCHGADGTSGATSHSIVDRSFLALVSDQSLRTLLIAGRPDIGQPDWRGDLPGRPLASQEIADVVAWLRSSHVH